MRVEVEEFMAAMALLQEASSRLMAVVNFTTPETIERRAEAPSAREAEREKRLLRRILPGELPEPEAWTGGGSSVRKKRRSASRLFGVAKRSGGHHGLPWIGYSSRTERNPRISRCCPTERVAGMLSDVLRRAQFGLEYPLNYPELSSMYDDLIMEKRAG